VAKHAPGDEIKLTVFREGSMHTHDVTLGDRTSQFAQAGRPGGEPSRGPTSDASEDLGIDVADLTPEVAAQIGVGDRKGVVITNVGANSPAAKQGLQGGELITMVGKTRVTSADEFHAALRSADTSKGIALQVFRGELARIVVIKPGGEAND
jgi:serine protease Do